MTTHLVVGDTHAHPDHNNDRADLLSRLIIDIKPDVYVHIGDSADMASLSTYDRGLSYFVGRNYRDDINSHLEFEDRVWGPVRRQKKKLPRRVFCVGNHEDRIARALSKSPELNGAISMKDLQLEDFYDDVVYYDGHSTPGIIDVDGIDYAHFVVAGISGRPLGAQHQGHQLIQKRHKSTTVGHSHVFNYTAQKYDRGASALHGLSLPCFVDYDVDWAGNVTDLWSTGVVIKHGVEDGNYDLEFVSMKRLKEIYG
jgi:hypothetical protein